jgi:hypothetical protein
MRVYVNYLFECFLVLNIHRCRLNIIIAHTEKLSSVSIPLYIYALIQNISIPRMHYFALSPERRISHTVKSR